MNTKYINHFFSLKAAHDILPFFTGCKKTAAKEITESFGAYHNAIEHLGPINEEWVVVSVGDGKRPRTGAVFRFLTKASKVISIDQEADLKWFESDLKEIYKVEPRDFMVAQHKIEDIFPSRFFVTYEETLEQIIKDKHLLILGVHSHANISDSIKVLAPGAKSVNVLWMPCCKQVERNFLDKEKIAKCEKFVTYNDKEIWSAKNQIYLWKNLK